MRTAYYLTTTASRINCVNNFSINAAKVLKEACEQIKTVLQVLRPHDFTTRMHRKLDKGKHRL